MNKKFFLIFSILFMLTGNSLIHPPLLAAQIYPDEGKSEETEVQTNAVETQIDLLEDDWTLEEKPLDIRDPYESFNRSMFKFNNGLKRFVMDPLAKGFDFLIPKKVQGSLYNAFSNARAPVRFFNSLFQKKYKGAGREFGRFLVNSSFGIAGLFDPAQGVLHWEPSEEDFGQTLGHYDVSEGSYFVWPIFGPATRRDTIGFAADPLFDPFTWFSILGTFEEKEIFTIISGVKRINNYSYNVREKYNTMMRGAIDPYVSVRHAYIEHRRKKIEE